MGSVCFALERLRLLAVSPISSLSEIIGDDAGEGECAEPVLIGSAGMSSSAVSSRYDSAIVGSAGLSHVE